MSQPTQSSPKDASDVRPFEVTSKSVFSIAVPMTLAFMTTPLLGMADTAIVGQFADAALIGGLAIATLIFALLFGMFNFLRAATTGLVAQALGRDDALEQQAVFWRSIAIAVLAGCVLIALYPLILSTGLFLMDVSANVSSAASEYFKIRMFSAPATLMNFAILGYVLGKGQGRLGLLLQTLINGSNIILSFYLGLTLQWGIQGVAYGTFFAEYLGVIVGLFVVLRSFKTSKRPEFTYIFNVQASKKLMALNGDIMIRSLALVGAFAWFTRVGGQFGDTTLAANAILINFLLLAGYLLDGFATAAEQMAGRAIGANYREGLMKTVKLTLLWGFALAGIMMLVLIAFGPLIINITTTEPVVREIAYEYYLWAALISVTGVLAFQMDGIFIGATWSSDMRNMMLISLVIFVAASILLANIWGNHGLWLSLNLFMLIRGVSLAMILPRKIKTIFSI